MKRFNKPLGAAALVCGTMALFGVEAGRAAGGEGARPPSVVQEAPPIFSGWLILRGEWVPGPYRVAVGGDTVYVNGRPLKKPSPAAAQPDAPDPLAAERQELFQMFEAAWREWSARGNEDAAQQAAVEFWRATPLVAHAEAVEESCADLRVWFLYEDQPRYLHLHPWTEAASAAADNRREWLADLAADVEAVLARDGLLIVQNEGHTYRPAPGRDAAVFDRLAEIARTVPDAAARLAAMRELVPDNDMAEALAKRFLVD